LIGAETGIKTIAAVRNRCRLWVISGQTISPENPLLSVVTPIADKFCDAAKAVLASVAPGQMRLIYDKCF
jgi:hypothetical protein